MKLKIRYFLLLNFIWFWLSPFDLKQNIILCLLLSCLTWLYKNNVNIRTYTLFAFNCFIKPLIFSDDKNIESSNLHQRRLETFYRGQSEIYDATRQFLLRGRSSMLRLVAAQVKQVYSIDGVSNPVNIPSPPTSPFLRPTPKRPKKVIWIDIGGGTGWNIEKMNSFIPISNFHAVYLIDITPSLCAVAMHRFESLGWKNVYVVCADILSWNPSFINDAEDVEVGLITLSYALSMMPKPFAVVDQVEKWINPNGVIGVADFYVSENVPSKDDQTRHHGFLTRWFWQIWFETDGVHLHPLRRQYLEHKFLSVKSVNLKNWIMKSWIGIPYYIWIGTKRSLEGVLKENWFSIESSKTVTANKEVDLKCLSDTVEQMEKASEKANQLLQKNMERLTVQHIHGHGLQWRELYEDPNLPDLTTYIYAFTWEDPKIDLQVLHINEKDNILCLTSGGCNALEYCIQGPNRIHCVDMNPCQGHLMELKLASLASLPYKDVWRLFGEGYHPDFEKILDSSLSPYLSPQAFSFWKQPKNGKFNYFYETGCSGLAIKAFNFLVWLKGISDVIDRFSLCSTKEEQEEIWFNDLRPHFLDKKWIALLNNYKFAWIALGVPRRQFEMLLHEGSAFDYVANTFDPVAKTTLMAKDSYFYHLCLTKRYAGNGQDQCPGYLTEDGYKKLTETKNLKSIRIHTDSIAQILRKRIARVEFEDEDIKNGMEEPLTKAVVMDHMDWFTTDQASEEISLFYERLRFDGRILFRSSSKKPWYLGIFIKYGFEVIPVNVRMSDKDLEDSRWSSWLTEKDTIYSRRKVLINVGESLPIFAECIDRVNMYASCWLAIKVCK